MTDAAVDRADQVLAAVAELTELKGFPPTVRELGHHVGLSSTSTVHAHLRRLASEGRLVHDPTKPRTFRVVPRTTDEVVELRLNLTSNGAKVEGSVALVEQARAKRFAAKLAALWDREVLAHSWAPSA